MKTKTYMALLVFVFMLAACQSATPSFTLTLAIIPPTTTPASIATSTLSTIRYAGTEPYAYYDFNDSFENVTDLDAYGIASTRNTVKVNTTSYNMGRQSIEADGKVGDSLDIDYSVPKYLGTSSYDFSQKVIVLSVFIPEDSPIDTIWFEAHSGDKWALTAYAKIPQNPYGSLPFIFNPLPKGQWVEAVIEIEHASDWSPSYGPHGALTNEEALDILQHCDAFKIRGMNGASGGSVSTSFLLDDLRWLDRYNIPIDPDADSLRKYAEKDNLYMGSFTKYGDLFNADDAKFAQVLAQEFNLLEPEMGNWFEHEPSEGVMDFSKSDAMVNFAIGNHMAVFSYWGGWHSLLPTWLMNKSQPPTPLSELQSILLQYIDQAGQHYKGKIAIWNVFNEVINDAGDGFRNRQTSNRPDNQALYSPWVDGNDTSLIKAAFRQARTSDPNAILILNDFNTEEIGWKKSEFFYNYVKELVAEGVPIDGVGFEMHIIYPPLYPNTPYETARIMDLPTYLKNVDANVKRYNALGLKVIFSEPDVSILLEGIDISTEAGQAELKLKLVYEAQIYGGLMKVALANPNVIAFNTMNFSDRYSDVHPNPDGTGYGFPDMFDRDYNPKPAYDEVLKALMNP